MPKTLKPCLWLVENAGAKAKFKVRIARGPDGTKGFTAELQPGNRAAMLPPPPPEPETDAAELDERAGEEDESGQPLLGMLKWG